MLRYFNNRLIWPKVEINCNQMHDTNIDLRSNMMLYEPKKIPCCGCNMTHTHHMDQFLFGHVLPKCAH